MAQFSPHDRDRARQRVNTATVGIAILAAGATGAASVLAWHATAEASASTKDWGSSRTNGDDDGEHSEGGSHEESEGADDKNTDDRKKQQGGDWSGVSGGGDLPSGGITPTKPPKKGSGSGSVGSQGS